MAIGNGGGGGDAKPHATVAVAAKTGDAHDRRQSGCSITACTRLSCLRRAWAYVAKSAKRLMTGGPSLIHIAERDLFCC